MTATIQCKPNGPYLVKGTVTLRDSTGTRVTNEDLFLCRCGGSANKPFCDGTHKKNGFSDKRLTDGANDTHKAYAGKAITIHDNRSVCAHAGHCTDHLAAVFHEEGSPWIDPNGAPAAAVVETIAKCPSGALAYSLNGARAADAVRDAVISVTKDGPYALAGSVELADARWAQGVSHEHYTLCRCGASKNKPFCDGSHWESGFKG